MKNIKTTFLCGILFTLSFSCNDKTLSEDNLCVKGKYIDSYCSGFIIEILDNSGIGKDLKLINTQELVKNSVLANIDTSLAKTYSENIKLFPEDSIFYFNYINGSYPRKSFINCPHDASIIITSISSQPCNLDN